MTPSVRQFLWDCFGAVCFAAVIGVMLALCAAVCRGGDAQTEYYAVVFTAKWCGPCRQYKTSGKLDRLMKQIPTTVVDIDEQPQWGVKRVPTFWLAHRATRTRIKAWTGPTDVETIEREIRRRNLEKAGQ